jgi:putative toxin-antitoxin system antitoxin component (TIGR02293 family)
MPRTARSSRRDVSMAKSGRLRRLAAGGAATAESVAAIEQGLPISVLSELRALLREDEIERLVIPRRTLAHRRLRGEPLSAEESDRALRVARMAELATATLGTEEKAMAWLRHEHRLLGGRKPLDLSRTETGARLVENMLARIAWGAAI